MNTTWSQPKTNIFAATNDLRKCLASGNKARLIRMRNEDCEHPILSTKKEDKDFRNYKHHIGCGSSVNKIKGDPNRDEFEKYLSLNYVSVFGTEEAVKRYYETGVLSEDNLKSMGRSHLVNVDDLIKFLENGTKNDGHNLKANIYKSQYRAPEHMHNTVHFFDFFRYKHGSQYAAKHFRHKLWVVEMLKSDEKQPRIPVMTKVLMSIITALVYPLKFVPRKSVLRMPQYTNYEFRIGDVTNGFSVEFQIPKKFSFK